MSTPRAAPTVAVRGVWTAEVLPELARVRVSVGAHSADRATALRDLARRTAEVRAAGRVWSGRRVGRGLAAAGAAAVPRRPARERVTGYVVGLQLTVVVVDPEGSGTCWCAWPTATWSS